MKKMQSDFHDGLIDRGLGPLGSNKSPTRPCKWNPNPRGTVVFIAREGSWEHILGSLPSLLQVESQVPRKPGMVVRASKPSPGEEEAGGSEERNPLLIVLAGQKKLSLEMRVERPVKGQGCARTFWEAKPSYLWLPCP